MSAKVFIPSPSTTVTKNTYLLDVVVGKSTAILELLSGEDQTLLVRWDSLLVCSKALSNLVLVRAQSHDDRKTYLESLT